MDEGWTRFFFQGCPRHIVRLFRQTPQNQDQLQRFECNGSWSLGHQLRVDLPPPHTIMVLLLTVRKGKSKTDYLAKTVSKCPAHCLT